jgi:hypothetical protein
MGLPSPPRVGRQLTVPPREVHQALQAARGEQNTPDRQARYAVRAGFERAVRQGVAVTELRRYRGLLTTAFITCTPPFHST